MAPIPIPIAIPDPLLALTTLLQHLHDITTDPQHLAARDIEPRGSRPGTVKPGSLSAAILTVFCLLATFLALLVWWFFHIKGGFLWRPNDFQDYRSAVLRRPEEISDDAITVFTDGSARRGAGGSSAGARTEVLSAVWNDQQKLEAADRMTSISRGGRDLWGEFKSRLGIGLRGGEAPPMDTWGGRSEAGGTSVSTRTRIGRHVPGRLPGVCEVHHIGLDDYERAAKKAEAIYKEKLRQKERERGERLMAEQQGIPLQPQKPREKKKKKAVRRDWDNRSLETTTTLAAPALTATPVSGRRKDYEYESYTQETPARPKGWKPEDSVLPEVVGYDPRAYVNPKHLSHHLSTRTNRSYVPGDDPGDVPPPIRMKPKRQSMPPPMMKAEPVTLRKESTRKDKHRSGRGDVDREKSHRHHSKSKEVGGGKTYKSTSTKEVGGGKTYKSTSTKEVGGKGYVAASTKEIGRDSDRDHSKHRSSKRQVSEKTESTEFTSSEEYSSSEDYTETDSDEYTTESDSEDEKGAGGSRKPDLGTKVYHHPIPKRDVWNEVIAGGSGSGSGTASAGSSSAAGNRNTRAENIPAPPTAPVPAPAPPGHRHTRTGSIVMERVQQFQSRANATAAPPNPSIRALPAPGTPYSNSSGNRNSAGPAPPKALGYRRNG